MRLARILGCIVTPFACMLAAASAGAASVEADVTRLQHEWEIVNYQVPEKERERKFEALAGVARKVSETWSGRAEPLVWEGIILSSWANAKGGLGALGIAKQARARYEAAIRIDPEVLNGSAYNSLGVLYYKVPGWPVGFGDDKKAQQLLQKALAINPKGIDPNYFYGEYLVEKGKPKDAVPFLERALNAPPRPGREIADAGRRQEARKLLEEVRRKAG